MNSKWLFGGALVAAVIWASQRAMATKQSLKYFQYTITGIKFNLSNVLKPEVILQVDVYNPNRVAIPITSLFGNISTGGTNVASFKNIEPINIDGSETKRVMMSARISAFGIIAKILSGQKITTFEIEGMLKTPMFDLPISSSVTPKDIMNKALSGIMPVKHIRRKHYCKYPPVNHNHFSAKNNVMHINPQRQVRHPQGHGFLQYPKRPWVMQGLLT